MMKIASAHLWVHDQEVALKYWTEKVGMEVRQDVSLPDLDDTFRWLTIGPPGQDDVSIVLMAVPGGPGVDGATRQQGGDPTPQGVPGAGVFSPENWPAGMKTPRAAVTQEPPPN